MKNHYISTLGLKNDYKDQLKRWSAALDKSPTK